MPATMSQQEEAARLSWRDTAVVCAFGALEYIRGGMDLKSAFVENDFLILTLHFLKALLSRSSFTPPEFHIEMHQKVRFAVLLRGGVRVRLVGRLLDRLLDLQLECVLR